MLACPRCHGALPESFFNAPKLEVCPSCQTPVQVAVFPALLAPAAVGSSGEAVLTEGESSCFYHPAKRAVQACESCGRFLCALCDVDLNGQHLCPGCLESGKRKGRLKQLENRRVLYDSLALVLATAPLLIFYLTIFTAPAAVYIAIKHWNSPRSVVGRTRWRTIVALVLALCEMAGWALVLAFFIRGFHGAGGSSHATSEIHPS